VDRFRCKLNVFNEDGVYRRDSPFRGDNSLSILTSIIRDTPGRVSDSAPDLPGIFDRAVARCLSKDPNERYETAAGLRHDLRALAGTAGTIPVTRSRRRLWTATAGLAASRVSIGRLGRLVRLVGVTRVDIAPMVGRWIFKNVDRFDGSSGFCVGPMRSVVSEGWAEREPETTFPASIEALGSVQCCDARSNSVCATSRDRRSVASDERNASLG